MRSLCLALAIVLLTPAAANAEGEPIAGKTFHAKLTETGSPFMPPRVMVMSLVRTDRAPRSWKFLKLWPGKVVSHFYTELQLDGTTKLKESDHEIFHVKDDRPFSQSHPNLYIVTRVATLSVPPMIGAVTTLVGFNRK